jgi:hypothetical protein
MTTRTMTYFSTLAIVLAATACNSVHSADAAPDTQVAVAEKHSEVAHAGNQSRADSVNCSSDAVDCFFGWNQDKPECAVPATDVRARSRQLQRLSAPGL